ncbi:MAG: glycosyltransferase family 4 protein [Chroococcidiopsidaceae cyanobacterium CP_BM_ER_R8_30]|nr:glycosyltransferase family 4 protein [Chroococcidiopsidaceae cyanobacterium CP_BM_ER_R8_30]
MRIAQIAPLWERVPPPAYGGTELVVSLLTDELVRRGHEVTLFATADSITLAKVEPGSPQPLRLLGASPQEAQIYETLQVSKVCEQANEFDVIHSHLDFQSFSYANLVKTPTVHTIHGIVPSWVEPLFIKNKHQNFVSISNSQRRTDLGLNYVATVYNGIDTSTHIFHPQPDNSPYLAFLGRMSPEKGPHLAIEIAKRTGWHLKMAGKVDRADKEFFEKEITPLIDGKQIEFLGEANHVQKREILGGAVATLFPITWREPFGLVMIESMACGTPVIAMALGAAPEVIAHGKTGFLCHSVDECIAALDRISEIDRRACRQHVEQHFSIKSMVDGYEAVYQQVLATSFRRNSQVKTPAIAA